MRLHFDPLEEDVLTISEKEGAHLVLYNDDVNTFDFVIETLIKVCRHERIQAEQCAYLVHYTGRCSVKNGDRKKLRPMCDALLDRGLTAAIE